MRRQRQVGQGQAVPPAPLSASAPVQEVEPRDGAPPLFTFYVQTSTPFPVRTPCHTGSSHQHTCTPDGPKKSIYKKDTQALLLVLHSYGTGLKCFMRFTTPAYTYVWASSPQVKSRWANVGTSSECTMVDAGNTSMRWLTSVGLPR